MKDIDLATVSTIIAKGIIKELDALKMSYELKAPSRNEQLVEVRFKDEDYSFYILGSKVRSIEIERKSKVKNED